MPISHSSYSMSSGKTTTFEFYSKNFFTFYIQTYLNLISAFSSVSSSSFDSFRSVRSNGSGASQRSVFSSSGGGGTNHQNGSWFSIPSLSNFQSAAGIFDSKLMNRPPRVGQFFRSQNEDLVPLKLICLEGIPELQRNTDTVRSAVLFAEVP